MPLPDTETLLKLRGEGWTQPQIAKRFGVSQQAVSERLNRAKVFTKGPKSTVTSAIPWDLSERSDRHRISKLSPYLGIRTFIKMKLGEALSGQERKHLRAFLGHVKSGEVLDLDEQGFLYRKRLPSDGSLVIRWPEGVEKDPAVTALFERWPNDTPPLEEE
ncbi:hypothetical protein [Streptomyces sp. NPDC053048]|uniref:hypothetical protein n=1 Tax=Streptomyces sp. NPDC053048 TaxID=3365694 RepID=UPI0037CD8B8F